MYPQAEEFIQYVKVCFPLYFYKKDILDIGILLNENYKNFQECQYYITDITLDETDMNRDLLSAKDLEFELEYFDVILCVECLEYDPTWKEAIQNIIRMLKDKGLFIIIFQSLINEDSMDINKLNNIINFNNTFCYWDCYIDNNTNDYYFVAIKKSTNDNNELPLIIKYDNSISRIPNCNIENITNNINIEYQKKIYSNS